MQCIIPVLDIVMSPKPANYLDVLDLDSTIRNYDIPTALQMIDNDGVGPSHPLSMQQAMTSCTREIGAHERGDPCFIKWANGCSRPALLQLHKCYFTQALISSDSFTVKHKHAPSVLAVYSSACNLIWAIKTLYGWDPELSTRYTVLWANCFSAAVSLPVFVIPCSAHVRRSALYPSLLRGRPLSR